MRFCLLAVALTSAPVHGAASSGNPYAVLTQFVVGGSGGWDYLTVDPRAHHLLIARSDRVLVVDVRDGPLVATIPDTPGVHGIALAPARRVIAKLSAGGKPEFAVTDAAGRIFFNIEDKSQLGVIDSSKTALVGVWDLPGCEQPTGLALDVEHSRLFSVCENGGLAVTDAVSGRHVAQVPIGQGPDAAAFDRERGLVFSSNGQDGTLTVIHEDDPEHFRVVATVPTQKSARTMALDPGSHRLYLVAAQFGEPPAPTGDQPHPRPPVLDNTFTVLVVGN